MLCQSFSQVFYTSFLVSQVFILCSSSAFLDQNYSAQAQIIPSPDRTGTIVNTQGNQINITGGTQAGANLFHSFRDFNLTSSQIANFLSNPQTQNILARINGGNPSVINGLLQVTGGNSNLFLMNPSGIIFGQNARLNVTASFTATTANSIGFGNNNVFNNLGDNNFSALTGNPDSFIFNTNHAGSIVNTGSLSVGNGQNLSLIAGNTINTGRLTAPGGEIQLLAVPGTDRVRLTQPGQVLSLEFVPPINNEIRALDLPALLTGNNLAGIQLNETGQVQVAGTNLPNQQGLAIASGRIDVSSSTGNGGVVQILGNRVAALNSRINANGATGGGTVRLGGEYLGGRDTGIAPALRFNSQRTLVDRNSLIRANATTSGEGGRVIVWANQNTGYFGRITGRGATGRGAFVEISGRENLAFDGRVEIPGANGLLGSLLLDPTNITIVAGANNSQPDDSQVNLDATILSGDLPANMTISAGALGAIPGATAINITATGNIDFNSNLTLLGGAGDVSFSAATITSSSAFTFNTNGRNLSIVAESINAPNLSFHTFSNLLSLSGNIEVTANTGNLIVGNVITGDTTLANTNSGLINLNALQGNITAGFILAAGSPSPMSENNGGDISINAPNGSITANSVRSRGNGAGRTTGDITLNARNLIRLTGNSACNPPGFSICSFGIGGMPPATNGAITINQGGGTTTPFIIGNSAINGTAWGINAGTGSIINTTTTIPAPPSTPSTYIQGIVNIIATTPYVPPSTLTSTSTSPQIFQFLQNPAPPPTPVPAIVGTPPVPSPVAELPAPSPSPSRAIIPSPEVIPSLASIPQPTPQPVPSQTPSLPSESLPSLGTILAGVAINPQTPLETSKPSPETFALLTNPSSTQISARLSGLEIYFQSDFQEYLRLNSKAISQYSLAETQAKLNRITEVTRTKPALIYVFFAPPGDSNDFNSANLATQTNRAARDNDPLEVILVTGKGQPLRVQLPNTTRRQVLTVANNFRSDVTNFRSSRSYLLPAKQMYQWILSSLETELQAQGIDNLVFLMDTGLRSIPLAALHDGSGFIIERYSVGLMPSLNLTPPVYNSLEGADLLAMGATTFGNTGLNPLPAVSLELSTVSQLWQGSEFLNDKFTLYNLIDQRQARPFRIVHLATHGVFNPGDRSNSYIQFWDQRLRLDQLDQLNWGNPPVDLLVLSACQTALGDKDAELGFAGLAINAGVRSALASLWEVNDAATLGLMTKFYQQLQVTSTKAEALRQAQLGMLRGEVRLQDGNLVTPSRTIPLTEELRRLGNRRLIHPYYWSAFTIVGNPW